MIESCQIPWNEYATSARMGLGLRRVGRVSQVVGLLIESSGPAASIGDLCEVIPDGDAEPLKAEVVGFRNNSLLLMPLGSLKGIHPGSLIVSESQSEKVGVGPELLGRVLGPLGQPIDNGPPIHTHEWMPLYSDPINPMLRRRIDQPLDIGIRAINALLTLGRGQRIGIFSGSGVGKSTLLGMMARYTEADVNVIGLVGERGREVVEFLEKDLGPEGMSRSVVVVATSDQPPLLRLRAAFLATAIAEYFRAKEKHVLLLMDSVTRFAMAQREIGLARGEPPTSRGYPPSTFMLLPRLLERAGRDQGNGSITGLYTVLMEGDDLQDPIVDAVRGILDGHFVLSRDLASANHYPALDVLASISRLMTDLVDEEQIRWAGQVRESLASYVRAEDMINIGAYVPGSNPRIDRSIQLIEPIRAFLRQPVRQGCSMAESLAMMTQIFNTKPNTAGKGMR
ncbi:MAG: FliI/YscN family ATPase [Magnetococcales bacterium]|nr:FliI/YscN family ATPase [Magnetococcales bacterium]MBF0149895.1 FliI/YscN family ATPase [Magnetococcales bacterium]MBF0175078.1 FliI/YscN family ATPase [Magnetococcales bacterium]MBF0346549.1 FliI/YscN family ATPase [Magnetococcales bacterium]MBF0632022.1 FliI/YscN family ATPase [Magnetococcales bacterium]